MQYNRTEVVYKLHPHALYSYEYTKYIETTIKWYNNIDA